jgi:Xaa-Pro dipeptidase
MNFTNLFREHIQVRRNKMDAILTESKLDALIVDTGKELHTFEDDREMPFAPNGHFVHWCPLLTPGHMVLLTQGQKPKLFFYSPDDFWYEHARVGDSFWETEFDVVSAKNRDEIWNALKTSKNTAYHGPDYETAKANGLQAVSDAVKHRLNWDRTYKTPYEVACMDEATRVSAQGHKAAKTAFLDGKSELEIYYEYLKATRSMEHENPYKPIIALNEKGSYLHYAAKRDDVSQGWSLLIDAGIRCNGYACDITRTYVKPGLDKDYEALLARVDRFQQELCAKIKPGVTMSDMQQATHVGVAEILLETGLMRSVGIDEAVESGITRAFFPHGLGHLLGIYVHDVGGRLKDRTGTMFERDPKHPHLRSSKILEEQFVFTVEPGIYFIELLLNPYRAKPEGKSLNWRLIDKWKRFGGIRIEDDIVVTKNGSHNITRKYLP